MDFFIHLLFIYLDTRWERWVNCVFSLTSYIFAHNTFFSLQWRYQLNPEYKIKPSQTLGYNTLEGENLCHAEVSQSSHFFKVSAINFLPGQFTTSKANSVQGTIFFYTHTCKSQHECTILAWKIVSLTGIAWECQAVFSPPTYSSPTDRWANSALPRSIFQEAACEKKASESSCKVEHGLLTWRLNKSIDAVPMMRAASQPCLGKAEQCCIAYVSFSWWVSPLWSPAGGGLPDAFMPSSPVGSWDPCRDPNFDM